jgi:hypothetical protein
VTSPHYLPLVRLIEDRVPVFYYAVDSYRDYPGWNAARIVQAEREVIRAARCSIFVSDALMARAIEECGISSANAAVSMNATSERFVDGGGGSQAASEEVAAYMGGLPRPIAGVMGAISDRIDFDLLLECADSSSIGTLLFVGPQAGRGGAQVATLTAHPKCRFVGQRPHEELPAWGSSLDVAIIPYRQSDFNFYCSPLRLFDHLASGRQVVTTDACHQIGRFERFVRVGHSREQVLLQLAAAASENHGNNREASELIGKEHLWRNRGAAISSIIMSCIA